MGFEYLKTLNILYVEDEDDIRTGYERTLKKCAKELFISSDGEKGLEVFKKNLNSIDIVVTDIKMPKLSGIDMIKQIQELKPNINVIFTSAHSDSSYLFEALDMHVDGYLLKPVPIKQLMSEINKISKSIMLEKVNKQQEEKIFQMQKMAALGEMIGNIAHQWRQPLSVISSSASGMKVQLEVGLVETEEIIKNCDIINDNAQALSQTIESFRKLINSDKKEESVDINELINLFLKKVDESDIEVLLDLCKECKLFVLKDELIQCLINLYNNAKDIFDIRSLVDKYIKITTQIQDDTFILTFQDNGGGIEKDLINKIFEPYFTTKHQYSGTGLGLTMVYNTVVYSMFGNIEVENSVLKYKNKQYDGAKFIIKLPLNKG